MGFLDKAKQLQGKRQPMQERAKERRAQKGYPTGEDVAWLAVDQVGHLGCSPPKAARPCQLPPCDVTNVCSQKAQRSGSARRRDDATVPGMLVALHPRTTRLVGS